MALTKSAPARLKREPGGRFSGPQAKDAKAAKEFPTDLFHTRRARWICAKVLRGTGVEVRMAAVDSPLYCATNWWQHEEGLIAFQNEVVKSLYDHLKY